jgi:hypothetical protein
MSRGLSAESEVPLESRLQAVSGPARAGTPTPLATLTRDEFIPVDVAGHVTTDSGGKPIDRYAAL